ncbi:hypothetical protein AHF37_10979 [Paragonimus kellicotti]|nr:hypothetical protein AHF37_10979 [Paragonimus kellicotti]
MDQLCTLIPNDNATEIYELWNTTLNKRRKRVCAKILTSLKCYSKRLNMNKNAVLRRNLRNFSQAL